MDRTTPLLLLVAGAMIAAGCGSGSPPDEDGGPAAAPTFVGSEESAPDDLEPAETPSEDFLVVVIETPPDAALAGEVIVTVEDVSLADQDSAVVSEVRFAVAELDGNRVPIDVPIPPEIAGDLTAVVHVDRDGSGSVTQGDLLSTSIVPLPASIEGEVVVPVEIV